MTDHSIKPDEGYEPFGEEWKKEVNQLTKKDLIETLRMALMDKESQAKELDRQSHRAMDAETSIDHIQEKLEQANKTISELRECLSRSMYDIKNLMQMESEEARKRGLSDALGVLEEYKNELLTPPTDKTEGDK